MYNGLTKKTSISGSLDNVTMSASSFHAATKVSQIEYSVFWAFEVRETWMEMLQEVSSRPSVSG